MIEDSYFTVPILVSPEQLKAMNLSSLSLCYQIFGRSNQWFNYITDECTLVNAHYSELTETTTMIDQIGVRAVDKKNQCLNVRVDVDQCSAEVNGSPVTRYSRNGISVKKYSKRVRISVPNCNELTVVMWAICQQRFGSRTSEEIKFVVLRGLNSGHRPAHGLIGK